MSLPKSSSLEDQPHLTREECACVFEREFESVAKDIQEHPGGQKFIERLLARLPAECITLLLEGGLLEPKLHTQVLLD